MMSLLLVGLNLVFSSIGLSSNLLLIVLIFNLKGFAETEIILSDESSTSFAEHIT